MSEDKSGIEEASMARDDDAPRLDERADPGDVLALAPRIQQAILDEAATWEHSFDAGPGEVVSVSDAAHVAARWILEHAGDAAMGAGT